MSRGLGAVLLLVAIGLGAAALWWLYTTGGQWYLVPVVAALGIVVWLANRAAASRPMRGAPGAPAPARRSRWPQYALNGVIAGFAAGGVGLFAVVRITGWGTSEGWEGLQAIVSGMMGAFAGAVLGGVAGGGLGAFRDWRVSRRSS